MQTLAASSSDTLSLTHIRLHRESGNLQLTSLGNVNRFLLVLYVGHRPRNSLIMKKELRETPNTAHWLQ